MKSFGPATARLQYGRRHDGIDVSPVVYANGALSGVLSVPSGSSRDLGVVICSPLSVENSFSYRPLRTLANRIAENGIPALRFDWYGSGDSLDEPESAEGTEIWTDAIRASIEALKRLTGVGEIALLGLRIGASFAALEAARNPTVSRLALLAAYPKGSSCLREIHAYDAIARDENPENPRASLFALPAGSLEASGYLFSTAECEALQALELKPETWAHVPPRALVVSAANDRAAVALTEALQAAGSQVSESCDFRLPGIWSSDMAAFMPRSTRDTVIDWLAEDVPRTSVPRLDRPVTTIRSFDEGAVHEEALTILTERGQCLAVACTPPSGRELPDWVVFLNAGSERRSGSHRLATTWAREWAKAGIPSLRLDAVGIGDSGDLAARDELYSFEWEHLYSHDLLQNLQEFLDWLGETRGVRRFAVIGLCSGATNAYEVALADPRVAAIGMLNPPFLFSDDEIRQLFAWRELKVMVTGARGLASYLRVRSPRTIARALRGGLLERRGVTPALSQGGRVRDSLLSLREQGRSITMVCDDRDFSLRYFGRTLGPDFRDQLEAMGIELEIIESVDHSFQPLWCHELLQDALERLLASAGFFASPASPPTEAPGLLTA